MNWRSPARSILPRGKGRLSREPGAALFQGLRIRLTLWYCGVLGAALVLFGVSLYLWTQYFLLTPIASDARAHALAHEGEWFSGQLYRACPSFGPQCQVGQPLGQASQMPEQVASFDRKGKELSGDDTTWLTSSFLP